MMDKTTLSYKQTNNSIPTIEELKKQLYDFSNKNPLVQYSLPKHDFLFVNEDSITKRQLIFTPIDENYSVLNQVLSRKKNTFQLAIGKISWAIDFEGNNVQFESPLFLFDTNYKKLDNEIQISIATETIQFNPILAQLWEHHFDICIEKIPINLNNVTALYNWLKQKIESESQLQCHLENSIIDSNLYANWFIQTDFIRLDQFIVNKTNHINDYKNILSSASLTKAAYESLNKKTKLTETKEDISSTILPFDDSQREIIRQAVSGNSFVIQGPPGTGKTQTIVNILSEFLAKGKRVLVVSDKKIALQAVYEKFEKNDLHRWCSLVHNPKKGRRDFIQSLKENYEYINSFNIPPNRLIEDFKSNEFEINKLSRELDDYQSQFKEKNQSNDFFLKGQLLQKKASQAPLKKSQNIFIPDLNDWIKMKADFQQLTSDTTMSFQSFLKKLTSIFKTAYYTNSKSSISTLIQFIELCVNFIQSHPYFSNELTLNQLHYLTKNKVPFTSLIEHDLLKRNLIFENETTNFIELKKTIENKIIYKNYGHVKIPHKTVEEFINVLSYYQQKSFPFVYSKFRQTKKDIQIIFNGLNGNVSELLDFLFQYQSFTEKLDHLNNERKRITQQFHLTDSIEQIFQYYSDHQKPLLQLLKLPLIKKKNAKVIAEYLNNLNPDYFLFFDDDIVVSNLIEFQKELNKNSDLIIAREKSFKACLTSSLFPKLLDYDLTPKEWDQLTINNAFHTVRFKTLEQFNEKIELFGQLFEKKQGLQALLLQQRLLKKAKELINYALHNKNEKNQEIRRGFQLLKKEWGKTKSHQKIKTLLSGESSSLIKALHPIFLCNSASATQIFPMKKNWFDLVVFDEASQLNLAEALPIMVRAKQVIISGDIQQMPPNHLFQKSILENKHNLLSYYSKIFDNYHLRYHYRSTNPHLFEFSNQYFYDNALFIAPALQVQEHKKKSVLIRNSTDAAFTYSSISEQSIHFHKIENGIYEDHTNEKEADYIAEWVKHYLLSQSKLSVGIVCMSVAQQQIIEEKIQKIQFFDKGINDLILIKQQYYPSFKGIFVSNLENVQGIERDIIIISTCYGLNKDGNLYLRFGLLNQIDGDKRLNVLVTRAKKHLLVVSSIDSSVLNHSTNKGIIALKAFLAFAEDLSINQLISNKVKSEPKIRLYTQIHYSYLEIIKDILSQKGYEAIIQYGQFCIAIKEGDSFVLGVLSDLSYKNLKTDLKFNWYSQQKMMNLHGWQTLFVSLADIILNPQKVVIQIEKELNKIKLGKKKEIEFSSLDYYVEEKSLLYTRLEKENLFWQIAGDLNDLIVEHGQIGKSGKKYLKRLESVAAVIKEKRKLIKQKEKKGYRRV